MKVLIANPGSTSYKCKLYETSDMSVLFQATVERIGDLEAIYSYCLYYVMQFQILLVATTQSRLSAYYLLLILAT